MAQSLLTTKQIAEELGVPLSWVYSRTRKGKSAIPFTKLGKYIRFNKEEVLNFFKAQPLKGDAETLRYDYEQGGRQ